MDFADNFSRTNPEYIRYQKFYGSSTPLKRESANQLEMNFSYIFQLYYELKGSLQTVLMIHVLLTLKRHLETW